MPTDHAFDEAIAAYARRQYGVFSRAQAKAKGATRDMIDHRIAVGRWFQLTPNVFALAGNPPTWERQMKAAELAVPGAVVSGRAAAAWYGLDRFSPVRPEITVGLSGNHRCSIATIRRREPIPSRTVRGLRVVTGPQLVVDLAPRLAEPLLGDLVDDLVLKRITTLEAIHDRYLELAGRPIAGIGRLPGIFDARGEGYVPPESQLERELFRTLDHPGIPPVTRQAPFPGHRRGERRVDGFIADWSMIVEGDGRTWHARLAAMEEDRERDLEAAAHGIMTLRFSYVALTKERTLTRRRVLDAGRHRASGLGTGEASSPGPAQTPAA